MGVKCEVSVGECKTTVTAVDSQKGQAPNIIYVATRTVSSLVSGCRFNTAPYAVERVSSTSAAKAGSDADKEVEFARSVFCPFNETSPVRITPKP